MAKSPKMGAMQWGMLLILSILWGGSFFFSKIALGEIAPYTLVLLRVSIAAVVLLMVLKLSKGAMPSGAKVWRTLFMMGLINNAIPFSLLFWGQAQIASSLASILNATTPLFTVLIAHFLTDDEKISPSVMAGIALGFLGVAVMLGVFEGFGTSNPPLAMLACIGVALSYAFAAVFGRRLRAMHIAPATATFGQLVASSLIMLPVVAWFDPMPVFAQLSPSVLLAVLVLAVFCTALAYLLYFRILSVSGATNISLVTLLVPVSAILLGTLVLGEALQSRDYIGMALIGVGLLAIDGRVFRAFGPPH